MSITDYSLARAYKRIEMILIKSMIRNFKKHKADELEEGFAWDQWQVVQLEELERYRLQNQDKFDEDFADIHRQIDELFRMTNKDGQMKEEAKILDQIRKGNLERPGDPGIDIDAFGINERKLNALIDSTTQDLEKAEHAVLRKANDTYRQVIFDAQVYAANGGTYEQAVDMATADFCKRGIRSIVYKNGARHNIADYAAMALRTGNKRAYLLGEGQKHAEYGVHTVRVNKRPDACPLCLRWTGHVLIDDVYGGGTVAEAEEKRLPLLSTAMRLGFLHPNCKDTYSLYIEGVSKPADPWTEAEIRELAGDYNHKQALKRAQENADMFQRLAETRLDPENRRKAEAKAKEWRAVVESLEAPESYDFESLFSKDNKTPTREVLENDSALTSLPIVERYDMASDREIATIFSKSGEIRRIRGSVSRIDFIDEDLLLMRAGIVTHNHPNGSILSPVDVLTGILNAEAVEVRSVTPFGLVTGIRDKGASVTNILTFVNLWEAQIDATIARAEKEFTKLFPRPIIIKRGAWNEQRKYYILRALNDDIDQFLQEKAEEYNLVYITKRY